MCSHKRAARAPDRTLGLALAFRLALGLALGLALSGCAAPGGVGAVRALTPAGASHSTTAGWSTYHDPAYGFVVAYPSDATAIGATATGDTSLASWRFANPQGGADTAADVATLEVTATTQASAGVCTQYTSGKPVSLAGGVTGYQQDNLSDPAPASAASQPQIAVIVLHGGLLTIITLTGQGQPGTFLQRWGSVWNHILTTFQPGRGPAGAQPCG
jgi:hypothetical protein